MGLSARLLTALGVSCMLLGAWLSWQSLAFGRDALTAVGQVVSYREVRDRDQLRYRPRVRYRTATGEIVQFDGQLSAAVKRFAIGTEVPVSYPLNAPVAARIALFTDNWLGATAAGVIGVVTLAAGILLRRATRREAARSNA